MPLLAAAAARQPGHMDGPDSAAGRQAGSEVAASARRLTVIVGKPAGGGGACRVEDPCRLLRVWSLLQATSEEIDRAALPPEGMPRLQRQLQAVRHEIDKAVSPSLAAELRRILPPQDAAPSAGALRIECAVLLSWTGSLVIEMLSALASASRHLSRPPAARRANDLAEAGSPGRVPREAAS